jgi:hypothetical protein
MLRLVDIPYQDTTTVTFYTEEILAEDVMTYVVYDTSTGYTTLQDYYAWRATTYTSTGMDGVGFVISNAELYPKYTPSITDYSILDKQLFYVVSSAEYQILKHVLDRIDLVRKRLPNPGTVIEDIDGIGDGGVVSMAGGYPKKFSISEVMRFIEGALIEINIHPPSTQFYWNFTSSDVDKINNPYLKESAVGIPYRITDLLVQGAMIRALVAWGILEVDLNFTTSDSGLQITYDKVNYVASWMDRLLVSYQKEKELVKWDFANHAGIGVGSLPYEATGIFGTALNMIQHSGIMPLTSMLGFNIRTNVPL